MAYDIVIDGDSEFDFATIHGLKRLRKWANDNGGPALQELLENNETDDVQFLRQEIIELLKSDTFIPPRIRSTLDYMASVSLKIGSTAYITDGFASDDD